MSDYFDVLARVAQITVDSEYYDAVKPADGMRLSLKKAILECHLMPVITEIKSASPSAGVIRENIDPAAIALAMQRGGAVALSVVTEPKQFNGSLGTLQAARETVKLPILMKDIVLSPRQVYAASKMGANAILLIKALFDRGYCERNLTEMIAGAHALGLEVLLETHTKQEFTSAAKTDADLIGVNNRDLGTLKVNLKTTAEVLAKEDAHGKVVVSESGIKTPSDILFLRSSGADAFLIGSAVMASDNVEQKVKEFVNAK
jgi:indole-3-glycerol phosphate synthase